MTTSGAFVPCRWTESAAAPTATVAAANPLMPSASCSPKTQRSVRRDARVLLAAGKALQLAAAFGVKLRHLAREVAQRHVAVALDELVDAGLRPLVLVLAAREGRSVEVGLAFAPARQQALGVQARQDRHVGRVGPRLLGTRVERVHRLADRDLALAPAPDLVHHLGLELVQRRRDRRVRRHYDAV